MARNLNIIALSCCTKFNLDLEALKINLLGRESQNLVQVRGFRGRLAQANFKFQLFRHFHL